MPPEPGIYPGILRTPTTLTAVGELRSIAGSGGDATVSALPVRSRIEQLNDANWWRDHAHLSDIAIANLLECNRDTVRLARHRQGLPSLKRGRPHGSQTRAHAGSNEHPATQRYLHERRAGGPPATIDYLVVRITALVAADTQHDEASFNDELLALGSAVGLIWDHRQQLKQAA